MGADIGHAASSSIYILNICLLLIIVGCCFSSVLSVPPPNTSVDSLNNAWTSGYPGGRLAVTLDDPESDKDVYSASEKA